MIPESYSFRLAMRALRCRLLGQADTQRWTDLGNFDPHWDLRTAAIASLMPKGSRVIEFGAGRQRLEAHLDASCTYTPADLVKRDARTIVIDLTQRPLPDLRRLNVNVAVFGGVLEYIAALGDLPGWLSEQVPLCIASYEYSKCASGRKKMLEILSRMKAGWVNHYSESDFTELFQAAGFYFEAKAPWGSGENGGSIFVFDRRS